MLLLLAVLWATFPCPAAAASTPLQLLLTPQDVKQGGIATLQIAASAPLRELRVQAGGQDVAVAHAPDPRRALAWIGVDLEHPPGPMGIRADAEDAAGRPVSGETTLVVLDADFPVQRLTLPRTFVELDAATLERVAREKAVLDRVWEILSPAPQWHGPFQLPLDGATVSAGFGLRRIINGEPRSPHTGVDLSAAAGAPVLAANAGTVAWVGQQFFAGTMVILDHGMGLYTMYFHLQDILVQPGQHVERGDLIARVGSTGRATGPHLHWGARLQGARIDPLELLRLAVPD